MASNPEGQLAAHRHLPDEVLLEIFSYLPRDTKLTSFTLASRHFKNLIEEFLYHTFDFPISWSHGEVEAFNAAGSPPHDLRRIRSLIKLLENNPELGFHTRSLSLSKYACILYEHGDHSRLLRCLPNLQHLSLSPPPVYDRTQRDLPLQSLRLGLGHIQHSSPEQQHQTLQIIAHNFWLPSLRKIQLQALLSDFTETIDPHPYFPLPPTRELSCVEDIRISQCIDRSFGTDQRMVQRLLGNTRSLKRFVFDNSWQPGAIVIGDREVDITERVAYDIKDGLEYHTSTLEEIVISADDGGFGSSFALRQHLNFNGKEFTEVRRLALLEVMFLVDFPYDGKKAFLSDKLEEIQVQFTVKVGDFRGDDREDQDLDERVWKMEWLLSLKGNELPNLKRVIWWYQPFQSHEGKVRAGAGGPLFGSLPTLQKLQGMFEQVGVKFEWISTRLLSETPFGMRLND